MNSYKEIEGDLIVLAKEGKFDVIAHGCNCFCAMGAGLAPQMAKAFGCDEFTLEGENFKGDINKLGQIDYDETYITDGKVHAWHPTAGSKRLYVVNCYSQYGFGANHKEGTVAPLDYPALVLCFRKMNKIFEGLHVGLPQIGCHLAGGDWAVVKKMIQEEFVDCNVTVVIYNGTK